MLLNLFVIVNKIWLRYRFAILLFYYLPFLLFNIRIFTLLYSFKHS